MTTLQPSVKQSHQIRFQRAVYIFKADVSLDAGVEDDLFISYSIGGDA